MEGSVHMLPEGVLVELIIKPEPSLHREYVWHNQKGNPMLYVQLKRALYSTLQAAYSSGSYYPRHYMSVD